MRFQGTLPEPVDAEGQDPTGYVVRNDNKR